MQLHIPPHYITPVTHSVAFTSTHILAPHSEESAKTEKSETATEPAASVQEDEMPAVEQAKDEAPVLEADQEQVAEDKDTDTGSEKK